GRRAMETALPLMLRFAEDPDPKTRTAALSAMGTIGGDREASALVKLVETQRDAQKRADTEKALLTISSRRGASCTPLLLPLAHNNDSAVRVVALRALASAGGPKALEAVRAATEDKDEAVSDEAIHTLAS